MREKIELTRDEINAMPCSNVSCSFEKRTVDGLMYRERLFVKYDAYRFNI